MKIVTVQNGLKNRFNLLAQNKNKSKKKIFQRWNIVGARFYPEKKKIKKKRSL